MRYWVYKDSRILGPMGSEELAHIDGGSPELLVCPEGAEGSRESDWKTAGEVPGLAEVFPMKTATAVSVLDLDPMELDPWSVQGFSGEELEGMRHPQSWGSGPVLGPPARQREALEAQKRLAEELDAKAKELDAAKRRADELEEKLKQFEAQSQRGAEVESQLKGLQENVARYELQQGEILEKLSAKDRVIEERSSEIERLRREVEETRSAADRIKIEAAETAERIKAEAAEALERAKAQAARQEAPRNENPEPPALPSLAPQEAAVKPVTLRFPSMEAPEAKVLDIPPALSLPSSAQPQAAMTPFSLSPMAPAPVESSAPPVSLNPPELPVLGPAPAAAVPTPFGPPPEAADIPGGEAPSPGLAALASAPTPMPAWGSAMTPLPSAARAPDPFMLPRTMIGTPPSETKATDPFATPQAGLAKPDEPPSSQPSTGPASSLPPAPSGSLGTVSSGKTAAAAKGADAAKFGRSKKVMILGTVLLLAVLLGTLLLIKGVRSSAPPASSSGAPEEPSAASPVGMGQANPGLPAPPPSSFGKTPQPSPGIPSGTPVQQAPRPSPQPATPQPSFGAEKPQAAPGRDFIPDRSQEAIQLVKDYPLGGDRHSVAEWLQYSFLTPGTREDWSVNPGESAGVFFVQYQASQESQSSRNMEPIIYVFQADLDRRTVRGQNAAAKQLLSGGVSPQKPSARPSSPKPAPVKAQTKPRKHRAASPALKPGELPLLPLPSETELRGRHKAGDDL